MSLNQFVLFVLNGGLLVLFAITLRRPGLLGFAKGGRWYATWLTIGVITLMDELTSVFYAPAEAHRFIGHQAIFFIAFTSILMRLLSSRMVEIAQILEMNDIRGGGVYSFSYLVLGPVASFVAVASIMVDYILTACISTVSAVINGTYFLPIGPIGEYLLILGIIWAVAGLNILGIRENARVTFFIFIGAAFVFVNLIALGVLNMPAASPSIMLGSGREVVEKVASGNLAHAIQVVTIGIASCVLAYSGIESVIQTAGLVEGWRDISRAYWFLALTVGIVTPAVSALALSYPIDFKAHEGDLIPHWASMVGSPGFAAVVGVFGSIILIMAVNTAYVASSELLERVAERYRFHWLTATNKRDSLYRIHLISGVMYTAIILLTRGSQSVLAEMYAVGLLASFCINLGCLLVYRYLRGTKDIRAYYTSRSMTFALELVLVACFIYLALHKPYGTALWAGVVVVLLAAGIPLSRRYGPEVRAARSSDFPMQLIVALAQRDGPLHVYFRRPGEESVAVSGAAPVYVTFFSVRQPVPAKLSEDHFRFPVQASGVIRSIIALLSLLEEEFGERHVEVHLGWPTSSWIDRMATGVFVANMLKLPKLFPLLRFSIEYESGVARPNARGA